MNELYSYPVNDYRYYLTHHGVPGMKWGVRRYQNYDGTLTAAGRKHISSDGQGFKQRADLHSIKRGQSVGRRIGEFVVPVTAWKMPMKTITGRKTTVGMETLAFALAGGSIGNLALTGAYYGSKSVRNVMDTHHDDRAAESSARAKSSYNKSTAAQANYKSKKKN